MVLYGLLALVLLLTQFLSPLNNNLVSASPQEPAPTPVSLSLPGKEITQWQLDESAGYIYAISRTANQLLFIRYSDMTVQKTINIGSTPTDLVVDDGKIYVGLEGAYQIKVVDIASGDIVQTIATGASVSQLTKDDHYIYFNSSTSRQSVYKYNLSTGGVSALALPAGVSISSIRDLKANKEKNLLYVASNVFTAVDLTDTTLLKSEMDPGGYNFWGSIIAEGDDVFYAAHRLNAVDLTEVRGMYTEFAQYHYDTILQVRDNLVITDRNIYDKENYRVITSLPQQSSLALIDSNQNVYTVSSQTIYKTKVNLPALSYDGHSSTNNRVELRNPITDWVSNSDNIFAISTDNTMLQINKKTMTVDREINIGSKPVDINIVDNQLYVANNGSSSVGIINPDDITNSTSVQLSSRKPKMVAAYEDQIFFISSDFSRSNNTLNVYSSVTGSVYEIKKGYSSINAQVIKVAPEEGVLYAIDGNTLYGIEMQYPYKIQTLVDNFQYSTRTLLVDGPNIYAGTKKYSKDKPAQLLATFPDQVIFAKDSYAFTTSAVYDSTSAVKIFDLPFITNHVDMDESGAIYISKATDPYYLDGSGAKMIYKFDSLDYLKSYMNNFTPGEAVFLDYNYQAGLVSGLVVFEPAKYDFDVDSYEIYYMDDQLNIGSSMGRVTKEDMIDGKYYYEIYGTYPQSHQKYIAIFGKLRINENSTRNSTGYSLARLWDTPTYFANDVSFTDTDPSPDKIGGVLEWNSADKEDSGDSYEVYFVGLNGLIGERVASANTKQAINKVNIASGTSIPDEALAIAVIYKDSRGELAPLYSVAPILDRMTRTPVEADIKINNNLGTSSDSITVSNLQPGETVRIYSDEDDLLHTVKLPHGKTELTIPTTHLNALGGYIYLSLQDEVKAESLVISKGYLKESNTSGGGGTGGGNNGGGGTGGGNSGGGGIPGGVIGGGLVTIPPQGATVTVSPVTNIEGRATVVAQVGALTDYLAKNKSVEVIPIEVKSDDAYAVVEVQLNGKELLKVASELTNKTFEFKSKFGTIRMGAEEIISALTDQSTLKVKISYASDEQKKNIEKSTKDLGITTIGTPVEFEVVTVSGEKVTVVQSKNAYWAHIIELDKLPANIDMGSIAGAMFDPASGTVIPVPSTFKSENGKIIGTLWRKGNSSYMIVQKDAKFTDLPVNVEAKQSIEKLAKRFIINGYGDGSFRPEKAVTRAEFAALLVRALGIAPQNGSESVFTDVKSENWFYNTASAASKANLIKGYVDGSFQPQKTITHSEMIAMLGNALKYIQEENMISDDKKKKAIEGLQLKTAVPVWMEQSLAAIAEIGVVRSGDQALQTLDSSATRQETALYLYRLLKAVSFID